MKYILTGFFGILLTFSLTIDISAEENTFLINPYTLSLNNVSFMNQDLSLFSNEKTEVDQDLSDGRLIAVGFLNFFLGLGQATLGDWQIAGTMLFLDVLCIPWFFWAIGVAAGTIPTFTETISSTNNSMTMFNSNYSNGVIGLIGSFFFLDYILPYMGFIMYPLCVVLKFTAPFAYRDQKNQAEKTARIEDIRNWNFGFLPDRNGNVCGMVSFTAHIN